MDKNLLEQIGLTPGEARVYTSLLGMGSCSSGQIILKSKVSRSKVYEVLERLKEKGLVSEAIKGGVKYFEALSPNKIFDYLHSKELEIKEQEKSFREILPSLIAKQKSKEQEHEIKIYYGFEGLKTLYFEMMEDLGKKDEYLGFAFSPEVFQHKPILVLMDNFHNVRAKKGASAKILCKPGDIVNAKRLRSQSSKEYEYRISKNPFPPNTSIFKDTVATFIWSEVPKVFTIKSKDNADHYRKFFLELWNKSIKP